MQIVSQTTEVCVYGTISHLLSIALTLLRLSVGDKVIDSQAGEAKDNT